MTYAYENIKITFGGRIYSDEIWTNTLHVGKENGNVSFSDMNKSIEEYTEIVANEIKEWFVNPGSSISNKASLDWVKVAKIGTDGKYLEDASIFDFEPGVTGVATSNVAPQLSTVLSLTTDVRRGPARFGRIYPPLNVFVNANGREGDVTSKTSAFKQLIESINWHSNTPSSGFLQNAVIVASKVGTGKNAYVTGVRVGDVIDTQRSRRNALTENYVVQSVDVNPATDPTPFN